MKTPCEAVVLRYVHDAATEEFVNVGVILWAPEAGYADARFVPTWTRVSGMFHDADLVHLRRLATAVARRLDEWTTQWRTELPFERKSRISDLISELFAKEESGFQASRVISGVTADPQRTLRELCERHVQRFLPTTPEYVTRDDDAVWRGFVNLLPSGAVVRSLVPYTVKAPHYDHEFSHAWKNGIWNVAQPVSFDLLEPRQIREKAVAWVGRLLALSPNPDELRVSFLVGYPASDRPRATRAAARDGADLLRDHFESVAEVVDEREAGSLAEKIARDVQSHRDSAKD